MKIQLNDNNNDASKALQKGSAAAKKYIKHQDRNTLDIWLTKKGGDFDIFDGKLVVSPGPYNPKKDFITVKRIVGSHRASRMPPLTRLEKVNGEIYSFSTNKKQLKPPVDIWIPCQPITHPHLQEIKLKAKYKGETEWVYHEWSLFATDPQYPIMEFSTDRLGCFVATVQPKVEKLTVSTQGLLYNARINRYISLRFPKKCVDTDLPIQIRILPVSHEKAMLIKDEFKQEYPDLNDLELITDYFDIMSDHEVVFRRSVSIKLPTNQDGFDEENRDSIIILRKDAETQEWVVVESHMKITKTTVTFDTKHLGRFVIVRAPSKRKLRMLKAVPVLERKNELNRREILVFKRMSKKSWSLWVELVRPSEVEQMIDRREGDGMIVISRPEIVSTDLDGDPQFEVPLKHGHSQISRHHNIALTESEIEFQRNDLENIDKDKEWHAVNIYDTDSDEHVSKRKKKSMRQVMENEPKLRYVECVDSKMACRVTLEASIQKVEQDDAQVFFVEKLSENFLAFEFEPSETEIDGDLEAVINVRGETINALDGLTTPAVFREVKFTITAEQFSDYFWLEPEPEPEPELIPEVMEHAEIVDQPTALISAPTIVKKDRMVPRLSVAERIVMESTNAMRLAVPSRPRQIIYREPRVLSGRSLQTLAKQVEEGLTLAVYLDIPDSTITGIGFDALSNGLSLPDVTYRILLRWKRTTQKRGEKAVEELAQALRGMGRHDIVSVLWECHCKNQEITPESLAHLDAEEHDDNSNTTIVQLNRITVGGL